MKSVFTKLSLTALAAIPALLSAQTFVFDSVEGFSGVQGENGWSYAYAPSANVSDDLRATQTAMTYYSEESLWKAGASGGLANVRISAEEQSYVGAAPGFPLRYWTADQDYNSVTFATSFVADVNGVNPTIFYSTATGTQVKLVDKLTTTVGATVYSLDSTDVADMTIEGSTNISGGTIYNVSAGDRIYFISKSSGASQGSALQPWTMEITAVIPESSSSALLVGVLTLGLIFCLRRRS
ncbi:MAG: hypothetical protein Q7Q73_05965 [Verrucomicrobiota bacterium JB024]|nr:hypothetical protein [Verrucomicrobiota bacterium JB024]